MRPTVGRYEGPHTDHHSLRATPAEVIEKIAWRRWRYHFGPAKITRYVARYQDVTISVSGGGGS